MATTKTKSRVKKAVSDADVRTLVTIKALQRAAAQLTSRLENKKARLSPGSRCASLTVKVKGDIVVEKCKTIASVEKCEYDAHELLVGLMVGRTTEEVADLIGAAIAANKEAEKTASAGVRFEQAESLLNAVVESEAKKRGRWTVKPESTAAGATTGAPSVSIRGSVDNNEVEIDVEAGGDAEVEE